tara:strand:+ start:2584 stop:2832 length:249 start_codon:yes stop_codon:yes gene_type:complete
MGKPIHIKENKMSKNVTMTTRWKFTAEDDEETIEEMESSKWFCDNLDTSDPRLWQSQFADVDDVVVKQVAVTVMYQVVHKES